MIEKLNNYVEGFFLNVENSNLAIQLKEELKSSIIEKYHQATNAGSSEENSFTFAKESLGDISILIKCLLKTNQLKEKM